MKKLKLLKTRPSLMRDVRQGDLMGHCDNCKKDTYFRKRPPCNDWRCIRCLASMDRYGREK